MHLRRFLALPLLVLAVATCGTGAEPVPDVETTAPSPEPTVGESPLSPPATPKPAGQQPGESPLPQPETSSSATPSDPVEDVVTAAREYLAGELEIPLQEVAPVLLEPDEWSDASLGCPEPGKAYAKVVTPGYRIVLRVGEKEYELHTDRTAQSVVICQRKLEERSLPAVEHLAAELGIAAEEIDVLSVTRYEWPDTSLACPEPGRSYAQVVTEGYSVILRALDGEYEVRTDLDGRIVVICEPEP
jgi:hypothetical protein